MYNNLVYSHNQEYSVYNVCRIKILLDCFKTFLLHITLTGWKGGFSSIESEAIIITKNTNQIPLNDKLNS